MGLWNRSVIGLELDSREIRAIELGGTKKKPIIRAWGRVRLPEGVVKEGRIVNTGLFSVSLQRLFTENGFKSKDVILGVNNQDVIVRFATFPKVPEDKIKNMIRFQAQDYIPVSIEELELDYILAGEKKTEEGQFLDVILVGARKKMLNDFIEAFNEAHMNILEIDSTMLALGRSALIESKDGNFALICFNNDIGNILIFKDGILGIARSVPISQNTNTMADGKSNLENDEIKIIADVLFGEVKSSLSYYMMQNNENIESMFILGCDRRQKQLVDLLSERTGFSVTAPQPYKHFDGLGSASSGFNTSDYVAAISLAIRGLEDK